MQRGQFQPEGKCHSNRLEGQERCCYDTVWRDKRDVVILCRLLNTKAGMWTS